MGLRRFSKSFGHALEGLRRLAASEPNFRIHCVAGIIVLEVAALMGFDSLRLALLVAIIGAVLITESINSAAEHIIDALSPRVNGIVAHIKDILAAAVLIASLQAVLVGVCLFGPPALAWLQSAVLGN